VLVDQKKIALSIILIIGITAFILPGCADPPDDFVIRSLPAYDNVIIYSEGEFQDCTDFYIYHYKNISLSELENNKYLNPVKDHTASILPYIEDFEKWIAVYRKNDANRELPSNYDFEKSIIDENDYFYIDNDKITSIDKFEKFANYTLYLFDTQTNTLFYFHNNT